MLTLKYLQQRFFSSRYADERRKIIRVMATIVLFSAGEMKKKICETIRHRKAHIHEKERNNVYRIRRGKKILKSIAHDVIKP